jgi:hypothetical protein
MHDYFHFIALGMQRAVKVRNQIDNQFIVSDKFMAVSSRYVIV